MMKRRKAFLVLDPPHKATANMDIKGKKAFEGKHETQIPSTSFRGTGWRGAEGKLCELRGEAAGPGSVPSCWVPEVQPVPLGGDTAWLGVPRAGSHFMPAGPIGQHLMRWVERGRERAGLLGT